MNERTVPARGRRVRRLVALWAFGLVLPPLQALANCQTETLELPVRMVGTRAVANVGINGTSVPLTVDSGAFYSMLTEAAAAQLKLQTRHEFGLHIEGLTGSVEVSTTRVDKLQLFKGEIPRVQFIVGGNEPGAGTMGLMGRNLLAFTDTEYDLPHGMIRFHFPNDDCKRATMAYWAGSTAVTEVDLLRDRSSTKTPSIRAEVKLNGKDFVALFDSGATTMVSTRSARSAGVAEAAMARSGSMTGAGRGALPVFTAPFDRFEIGNEAVSSIHLRVADLALNDADLLLGIDFFLSHRIYVSKQQSRLFFTYVGGPVFLTDKGVAAGNAAPAADPAASGPSSLTAQEYAVRSAASAARNDFEPALADIDRACELEPGSAAFLAQRGALLEAMKRPAKALEDFDKALSLDADQTDARARRAWLRLASKQRDGAKADADELDRTLPPQAQLRRSMAELYLRLDEPAQALTQLNDWLPAHPHEVRRDLALSERCRLRLRLGIELNEALDDCNDAVDADGSNPGFLDNRGWIYLRLGRHDRALSDFERSLKLRPGYAWALYGRALAETRLGDAGRAATDLAAARSADAEIDRKVVRAGLTTDPAPKPAAPASASG